MNILFIGYWAFHEGLTSSTILPHLKILSEFKEVNKVIFTSIERDLRITEFDLNIPKVTHIPLYSSDSTNVFLNKWHDFTVFPKKLIQYCKDYNIDKIICRGAPAGALGYMVWKQTKTPFLVESFEPHAHYMLESGVWKKWDPRYILELYWEKKQKKHAQHLIPVAHNYKKRLVQEGVKEVKIEVTPCTVDLNYFTISDDNRKTIQEQLHISNDSITGIYVGKFGGLYLDVEAFQYFKTCFDYWGDRFRLIILSPQSEVDIRNYCKLSGVDFSQIILKKVAHHEVPNYLNTADFAFTFYKEGDSKKYLSPIKIGEYWACGLPVLISKNIGDDSEIIQKEKGGIVIEKDFSIHLTELESLIKEHPKTHFRALAEKYRNPEIDRMVYQKLLISNNNAL